MVSRQPLELIEQYTNAYCTTFTGFFLGLCATSRRQTETCFSNDRQKRKDTTAWQPVKIPITTFILAILSPFRLKGSCRYSDFLGTQTMEPQFTKLLFARAPVKHNANQKQHFQMKNEILRHESPGNEVLHKKARSEASVLPVACDSSSDSAATATLCAAF